MNIIWLLWDGIGWNGEKETFWPVNWLIDWLQCGACLSSSSSSDSSGKGKSKSSTKKLSHGFHLVEGKSGHDMEDYHVAEYRKKKNHELGLFAIFDGHLGDRVPSYLKDNLFNNILDEVLPSILSLLLLLLFLLLWFLSLSYLPVNCDDACSPISGKIPPLPLRMLIAPLIILFWRTQWN